MTLEKCLAFFKAEGGPDGHRRDTMPMVEALRASGWSADTIFYRDVDRDDLFDRVVAKADAHVSRIRRVSQARVPGPA